MGIERSAVSPMPGAKRPAGTLPATALIAAIFVAASRACAAEQPANEWTKISEGNLGPGFSPGLVWSPDLKRFVFFCGGVSHEFKGGRPYDVMSFDPADSKWRNELPKGAEGRGEETGNVKDPGFKSPYYAFGDEEKLARPNPRHMRLWYQYAFAPWDGKAYMLVCGRVLCYDPQERMWKETGAAAGPAPFVQGQGDGLAWAALCADPVNREILLFGGCGVLTESGSPGTWVYSPEKNEWRKLELKVEPPPRALSPMVYDPSAKKILLFGGDGLDRVYADTWLYDCASRTWEERKPPLSPSPRFGHALLRIPKSGKIVLIGGKGYRTTNDYYAMLYRVLPFEMWTYDVAKNEWAIVAHLDKGGPPQNPVEAACAAVSDDDLVLLVGPGTEKGSAHSSWLCRLDDVSRPEAEGTAKHGVKPGTMEFRTGAFDPEWYVKDLPPPDPAANEAFLKSIPPNAWTAMDYPRRIENRQGGAWSTVALDTERDEIVHMGGGHSAYFGNDAAHYSITGNRWSISCRPMFALEFNYGLDGPGTWAFNGAPRAGHNYHAYVYDPSIRRIVFLKDGMTLSYDTAARTWPFAEKFGDLPFNASKYTSFLVSTPAGAVCWAARKENRSKTGLWKLEGGRGWTEMKTSGEPLPMTVVDSFTAIAYDSKRDRLIMTTSAGYQHPGPHGTIWTCDLKTGEVKKWAPEGMDAVKGKGSMRESVYLPKCDMVMFGCLLNGEDGAVVPFYDCDKNRWLGARMPGAEFMGQVGGVRQDLGLVYDPRRDLVWGVLGELQKKGSLRAARVDAATLGLKPLK